MGGRSSATCWGWWNQLDVRFSYQAFALLTQQLMLAVVAASFQLEEPVAVAAWVAAAWAVVAASFRMEEPSAVAAWQRRSPPVRDWREFGAASTAEAEAVTFKRQLLTN